MAVGFDVASESHTGTTGSASQASFTWNHLGGGSARAALVYVFSIGALTDTSVTYGGTTMTAVPYTAADTDTEPGSVRAYFLDNCGTGTKAVVVNRTNNAIVMYAVAFTITAAGATEVYLPGVMTAGGSASNTGASSSGTGTGTVALKSVTDGSPGANSLRFMGRYQGTSNVTAAGSGSTAGPSIDLGLFVIDTFRETTAGQGARNVGGATITDDVAMIALAIRELAVTNAQAGVATATGTAPTVESAGALPTYAQKVVALGATAYWRLGESGAATTAVDEIGTADGTYTNSPTLGSTSLLPGDTGNTAATFLASSDEYVTVPSSAPIDQGAGAFSWALIFQPTSAMLDAGGTTRFLMAKGAAGTARPELVVFRPASDWLLNSRSDGWGEGVTGTTHLAAGTTYYVVVTVSAAHAWKLYVNGTEESTSQGTAQTASDAGDLLIGRKPGSATQNADGVIDEVAVFKGIELTSAQVAALYAARNVSAGSPTTNANAGVASATGSSPTAIASVGAPSGVALETGTAGAIAAKVGPAPAATTSTGTAQAPNRSMLAPIGAASSTSSAPTSVAVPGTRGLAGIATETGTAPGPAGVPGTRALAGVAVETGTAPATASSVAPTPPAATATGSSTNPTIVSGTLAAAGIATATGTAANPGVAALVPIGVATATGSAPAPKATPGTNALAGVATSTETASVPVLTLGPTPPVASSTGTAPTAAGVGGLFVNIGAAAAATATAIGPAAGLLAPIGASSSTGTALGPTITAGKLAAAGAAASTVTAPTAIASLGVPAGVSLETGTALAPTIAIGSATNAAAGVATSTGSAIGATVTATPYRSALAGLAAAIASAPTASDSLAAVIGGSSSTGAAFVAAVHVGHAVGMDVRMFLGSSGPGLMVVAAANGSTISADGRETVSAGQNRPNVSRRSGP